MILTLAHAFQSLPRLQLLRSEGDRLCCSHYCLIQWQATNWYDSATKRNRLYQWVGGGKTTLTRVCEQRQEMGTLGADMLNYNQDPGTKALGIVAVGTTSPQLL